MSMVPVVLEGDITAAQFFGFVLGRYRSSDQTTPRASAGHEGWRRAKCIVAVNKDPEAPIMGKADYSILGDLFEVVPVLTAEIKKIKG